MGVKKEVGKAVVKGFKELAPNIKNYVKGHFGEVKQGLISDLAKNNDPRFPKIHKDLTNLTQTTDDNVRLTLGSGIHKTLDDIRADGEKFQTASTATNLEKQPRAIREGVPRKGEAKQDAVIEHLKASDDPTQDIPYYRDEDGSLKYLDYKETDPVTGEKRYAFEDRTRKTRSVADRRAATIEKTITLDEFIEELGKEKGTEAFNLNKKRMEKLYRWVSKQGANLDHIWPITGSATEGFHHFNNVILLLAKDNLSKGNKVLPLELFKELNIPISKRDLIRSTLEKPTITNKEKRKRILEALVGMKSK